MILISHRGNLTGPNPAIENKPEYIDAALNAGYDVEIDVWLQTEDITNSLYLGHDAAQYYIDINFLEDRRDKLWIHCKNFNALSIFTSWYPKLNFFYHTDEDYVLTNHKYIWAYPGKPGCGPSTICVLPEQSKTPTSGFAGICSDFIQDYKHDKFNFV